VTVYSPIPHKASSVINASSTFPKMPHSFVGIRTKRMDCAPYARNARTLHEDFHRLKKSLFQKE
jgi:hypothetical protein